MRKQDRIAREQQERTEPRPDAQQRPPQEREPMKMSGSTDQSSKPSREHGKIPLPD